MRADRSASLAASILLTAAGTANAQLEIIDLGLLPGGSTCSAFDVSADGQWVAGRANGTGGIQGVFWNQGVLQGIGFLPETVFSEARAISADGTFITGSSGVDNRHALRWTAGGLEDLGVLPGGVLSEGRAISADGDVITGFSTSPAGNRAFRWSAGGGMQDLGVLPGASLSLGNAISADGLTIVGTSGTPGAPRAMRWTTATGMQDLGLPGQANAVSADGAVIAGSSEDHSFRIAAGVVQVLQPPPGAVDSGAVGMSDDGHTIVGFCSGGVAGRAVFWRSNLGMVDLNVYLPTIGLNLDGWSLGVAFGANADGTVIAGVGTHNGQIRAWIVRGLPDFCYPDCNADGARTVADFGCFQTKFVAADPYADCNKDGAFTVSDFGCFQTAFVSGCP